MIKKNRSKDQKLVSNEAQELSYISKTYKIPIAKVREAKKEAGSVSRQRIYAVLRGWGYKIVTRSKPKG